MLDGDQYDLICKSRSELPPEAAESVRPEIVRGLGLAFPQFFEDFSRSFPIAAEIIQENWGLPYLIFLHPTEIWHPYLVSENQSSILVFNLSHISTPMHGQLHDHIYRMLPKGWMANYSIIDSFYKVQKKDFPFFWKNTPVQYAARFTISDYCREIKSDRRIARSFEKSYPNSIFRGWMLTDTGDALFIDENLCDKRVLHVQKGDFRRARYLADPETTLDRYLAHYLSGEPIGTFDFHATHPK